MRINSIQNVYGNRVLKNRTCSPASAKRCNGEGCDTSVSQESSNVQFKGYCGKVAGTLLGGAAAVGLALTVAPVLVCAAPILGVAGMVGCDKAEDTINEAMDDKKSK